MAQLAIDDIHKPHQLHPNSLTESSIQHLKEGLILKVGKEGELFCSLEFLEVVIKRLAQIQLSMSYDRHGHTYEQYHDFEICTPNVDLSQPLIKHPYQL